MNKKSMAIIRVANSYVKSANILFKSSNVFDLTLPIINMSLIGIELSLKSYLIKNGSSPGNSHNIDKLLVDSVALGFSVNEAVARLVCIMAIPYRKHAPRYAPLKLDVSFPPLEKVIFCARSILRSAQVMKYTDNSPISHEFACLIQLEEQDKYENNIGKFDPNLVYEGPNPPYPLGTIHFSKLSNNE